MTIIYKNTKIVLLRINNQLKICQINLKNFKKIFFSINFLSGKNNFRRKYNRKKELIIQAIKIKNKKNIIILDATAGLGKDSFILATSGYKVFMIEKNKIIYNLLLDGIKRAYQDIHIGKLIKKNMILFHENSINFLQSKKIIPDVIYLDPMFKNKKKSSPKKDLSILRIIMKNEKMTQNLLKKSLKFTKKKVVVKRSKKSKYLENIKPNYSLYGKKYRFDVYFKN